MIKSINDTNFSMVIITMTRVIDIVKYANKNELSNLTVTGVDKELLDTPFKDNTKYYFRRTKWAPNYFIKLALCTENSFPASDDIYNLTNREIINRLANGSLQLGLSLVHCIVHDDTITEKDVIISNHCVNNSDLFAKDWQGYEVH